MVKTIKMFGRTFEVKRQKLTWEMYYEYKRFMIGHLKLLGECYKNPSQTKRAIYDDWYYYFDHEFPFTEDGYDPIIDMGVRSYNCMCFTFDCLMKYPECNRAFHFHITPCHNYLTIFEIV